MGRLYYSPLWGPHIASPPVVAVISSPLEFEERHFPTSSCPAPSQFLHLGSPLCRAFQSRLLVQLRCFSPGFLLPDLPQSSPFLAYGTGQYPGFVPVSPRGSAPQGTALGPPHSSYSSPWGAHQARGFSWCHPTSAPVCSLSWTLGVDGAGTGPTSSGGVGDGGLKEQHCKNA